MNDKSSILISTRYGVPPLVHGKDHEMWVISAGVATLLSGLPPLKSLPNTFTTVGVSVTGTVLVGSEQPCQNIPKLAPG
jgi:hypothetical protein